MSLFDSFKQPEGMMELASIQMTVAINGTKFIRPDDYVRIEDGWLVSGDEATHKIVGCYGDISSSRLEIMVVDVITMEPTIFKLK